MANNVFTRTNTFGMHLRTNKQIVVNIVTNSTHKKQIVIKILVLFD